MMEELIEREVSSWPLEQPLALHPHLQRLTLEIILRAVFGLEQGAQLDDLRDALTQVLEFAENPLSVLPVAQRFEKLIPSLRRFRRLSDHTDRLIFELIDERRAEEAGDRDD